MTTKSDLIKNINEDITYISAEDNYVKINLKNGHYLLERMSLKNLEKSLDESLFVKTHRSFVVNMKYITNIKKNNVILNTLEIPVSVRRKTEVISKITKYNIKSSQKGIQKVFAGSAR